MNHNFYKMWKNSGQRQKLVPIGFLISLFHFLWVSQPFFWVFFLLLLLRSLEKCSWIFKSQCMLVNMKTTRELCNFLCVRKMLLGWWTHFEVHNKPVESFLPLIASLLHFESSAKNETATNTKKLNLLAASTFQKSNLAEPRKKLNINYRHYERK